MVLFSMHDLLDPATYAPPDSIFGNFDLMLCRKVLIYLNHDAQQQVCDKLALAPHGILVLGETELLPESLADYFEPVAAAGKIFQKR